MAEQKTEETKPAVPRRVARPFIGPAGAGSGTRPPLRPAAPTDRPRPAAFAPPLPQQRASLGVPAEAAPLPVPFAAPSPAPTPVAEVMPVAEVVEITLDRSATVVTDTPEHEIIASAPTPVTVPPIRPVTSEMVAIDAVDAFDAVWSSPEITGVPLTAEGASAPIDELSLGGGLDGPHLWSDEITAAPEQAIEPEPAAADMGGSESVDAVWPEPASVDIGMPAWLADDAEPIADPVAQTEASLSWPEAYATPPEAPVNEIAAEHTDADDRPWPDPLLAEYAPYIPTPSSVGAVPTPSSLRAIAATAEAASQDLAVESASAEPALPTLGDPTEAEPGESTLVQSALAQTAMAETAMAETALAETALAETTLAESGPIEPAVVADIVAHEVVAHEVVAVAHESVRHEVRVSAALDRLAERVRSGEIDVSSVAAEAPDAALLASVLAALLGGSSSR